MFKKLVTAIGMFCIAIPILAFNSSWGPEILRWGHDAEIRNLTVTGTTSFSSPVSSATYATTCTTATYSEDSNLLDNHDSTYFAIKSDVFLATGTLRTDLTSEISNRISEDDLISDATGQIRSDFESYDSALNVSTTSLRTDLSIEIDTRVNEISSLTTTYLGINAKADDSDLLDGYNYDYFLDTTTAASTYLGISAKAADSDLLDNHDSTYFVDTANTQSILGLKTFLSSLRVGGVSQLFFGSGNDRIQQGVAEGYIDIYSSSGGKRLEIGISSITISGTQWFGNNGNYPDNTELEFGDASVANDDYSIGYDSGADEIRIVVGDNCEADANVICRGLASKIFAVGDTGTINYADGSGDLYVEDELEVDGITHLNQSLFIESGANYIHIYDDIETKYGTGGDFSIGYDSGADELRAVIGNDVTTDTKVAWRVTSSTIVCIGDSGTIVRADGSGDLFVEDELEVLGRAYVGGDIVLNDMGDKLYIAGLTYSHWIQGLTSNKGIGFYTSSSLSFNINTQSAVIKSSTTVGLQGTTPIEVGETYFNTDTNELWVATGTAVNQFVHK